MKILLGVLAILGATTTFANSTYEIDFLVSSRGIVDQDFKVKDIKKFESLLWSMNNKTTKRFPFRLDGINFHNAWISPEGIHFKISMDDINNIKQLETTVPKGTNLNTYYANEFLCTLAKGTPEVYFTDFFRITLSGNMRLDFYDKDLRLFKSFKTNVSACQK